jgi:hypothetical protein
LREVIKAGRFTKVVKLRHCQIQSQLKVALRNSYAKQKEALRVQRRQIERNDSTRFGHAAETAAKIYLESDFHSSLSILLGVVV